MVPISILVRASSVVIRHHDLKENLGGKGLFHHGAYSASSGEMRVRTQGRILVARTEAEAMEGRCYWLASHIFLSLLTYTLQDCLLREDNYPQ